MVCVPVKVVFVFKHLKTYRRGRLLLEPLVVNNFLMQGQGEGWFVTVCDGHTRSAGLWGRHAPSVLWHVRLRCWGQWNKMSTSV